MAVPAPSGSRAGTIARRAAAAAAIVLAAFDLAAPGLEGPRAPLLVLDASESVAHAEEPSSEGDRIVFADGVRRARRGEDLSSLPRNRTRLADALREAAAALSDAPGARAWLVTDGRDTEGGAAEAAAALAAAGHPLDVSPPRPVPADVGLLGARVASEVAGGPRTIVARACASAAGRARISLRRDGAVVAARETPVGALADAEVSLVDGLVAPDSAVYEVLLAPLDGTPDDDLVDDRLVVAAPGRERLVLVVGDHPFESAIPGARSIGGEESSGAQADAALVIDVPWRRIGREGANRIARIAASGGVVVAVGGPDAWGPGGWSGTPLEAILPLRSRAPDTRETAVLLLLDASGSTSETPPGGGPTSHAALADAVARIVEVVPPRGSIAALPFRAAPDPAPLRPGWIASSDEAGRSALVSGFARAVPGGGTDLVGALVAGARTVAARRADRRIVVLATDGDPDHVLSESLLTPARDALAAAGVELVALVRGDERAAAVLRWLAGDPARVTTVGSAGEIPEALGRLFARSMHRDELLLGPFTVALTREGGDAAPIAGVVPSRLHALEAAPDATLLATATKAGTPALPFAAERRLGAGRVVAVAWGPDLDPAAAGASGRGAVANLVATYARSSDRGLAAGGDESVLEVRAEEGRARLVARRGERGATSDLFETAPGLYRGPWPAASGPGDDEPLSVEIDGTRRPLRMPARPPAESRGCGVDAAALEAIARAGGGRVLAPGESPKSAPVRSPVALAPWFALVAVALVVLDRARAGGVRGGVR